ncbi:MAG: OmpW family outer membrane protein [Pseudomonadota bacterium]|nr:OmpW family outer membrane protein [Pseudomonadota bacterium]HJO34823.1 OmpW family outer membrane protein [Gammaproteobacteria bacterium]
MQWGAGLAMLGVAGAALAWEQGDVLLRAGPAAVWPNDDSGEVRPIIGGEVEVGDGYALGLTAAYMVTDRIGVELVLATPFKHDLDADGALEAAGVDEVGSIKHLPPTLSVQYYPAMPADVPMQPYAGIGLNYTTFFDEDADRDLEAAVGSTDLELDDSWGLAAQVGLDVPIGERWLANVALWYIDIDTEAELATAGAGHLDVDVDIDPWVGMIGVGYRF